MSTESVQVRRGGRSISAESARTSQHPVEVTA